MKNSISGAVVTRLVLPSIGESPPLDTGKSREVGFNEHVVFHQTRALYFTMSGQEGSLVSATFSADSRLLATWTWDNVLRVWDARTGASSPR